MPDVPLRHREQASRPALLLLGLLAGTALLRVLYGSPALGYDSGWALVWGEELAALRNPDLDAPLAPTPHPLTNLLAALLSPLGDSADDALGMLSLLALAALGAAAYALGRAVASPIVGLAFAAIVLTRPLIITQALLASADIPFLALVVLAAALVARSGREVPAAGLALSVAGLLRPEAWLLAALWAILSWRAGRRALAAVVLTLPPLIWAGTDLALAGDPLHSLSGTRELAAELERHQRVGAAAELLPAFLRDVLGLAVLLGGVVGLVVALAFARLRARAAPVLALLGLGLVSYLAIGLAGLSVVVRYTLLAAVALAALCALALAAWRAVPPGQRPLGLGVAAAVLLVLAISLPGQVAAVERAISDGRERAAVRADLLALLERPAAARAVELCQPLTLVNYRVRPVVARAQNVPPEGLPTVHERDPVRGGSLLLPTALSVQRGFQVDPRRPQTRMVKAPEGHRPVAANARWRLLADCPGIGPR